MFGNSAKNAGDYRKQVKASSPFGGRLAKNIGRQSRPLCSFSRTRDVFEGFPGICGVCVNEIFSGGNYGRIQEGYYQFYEKPIVNSAGKRVNEFKKMMPLTDNVNSEISALFRRISPCVRFVEMRRGMYSSITGRAVLGVYRGL